MEDEAPPRLEMQPRAEQPPPRQEPAIHASVTCDECGACPIVGVRYKARHIYDYDICEACFSESTPLLQSENFASFPQPVDERVAREQCSAGPESSLAAVTFEDATTKIRANQGQAQVASLQLCDWLQGLFRFRNNINGEDNDTNNNSDSLAFSEALARDTHLNILHIHMCFGGMACTRGLADVAGGIERNTNLKRIFWCLSQTERKNLSAETLGALRDMVAHNSNLDCFYVKRSCGDKLALPKPCSDEDNLVTALLDGLEENTTLHKFRLDTYHSLSNSHQERLLDIVSKHKHLQYVWCDLQNPSERARLELLLACHRHAWLERSRDNVASPRERWKVLLEARDYAEASGGDIERDANKNRSFVEPVVVLFHLLRASPDLIERRRIH